MVGVRSITPADIAVTLWTEMAIFEPAGACEVRAAKKTVPLPAIMLEYMMETGSAAPAALALFAFIAYGTYVSAIMQPVVQYWKIPPNSPRRGNPERLGSGVHRLLSRIS